MTLIELSEHASHLLFKIRRQLFFSSDICNAGVIVADLKMDGAVPFPPECLKLVLVRILFNEPEEFVAQLLLFFV